MTALAAPTTEDVSPAGYAAVPAAVLSRLDRWDLDLFVMPRGAHSPVLLRDSSLEISDFRAHQLATQQDQPILVRNGDFEELSRELLADVDALVVDDQTPAAERFGLLQFAAAAEVEHACTLINPNKYVELSEKLGGYLSTLINTGDVTPSELFRVARHDYKTFAHLTNVSCYATVLAEALGISNEEERRQIAVGAMLHDVGKRMIPVEILRKPARLNAEEREIVEYHPQHGYEELVGRGDLSHGQLMMVYQHHECLDGSGYPVRITGEEIHLWAKLLTVVDVFDAMTGARPYRRPAKPEEAIAYLQSGAGTKFDEEMVQCWTKVMAAT